MNFFDTCNVSFYTWILVLTCLIFTIYYVLNVLSFNYWEKKGVKMAGMIPVIGDVVIGISFSKQPYGKLIQQIYEEAGNKRYIGYYEFTTPILMIKSPGLLKQLFVKDSIKFGKRRMAFPDHYDTIISKSIVYLKGQEWKECRLFWNQVLSASKVEKLYTLFNETARSLVKDFTEKQDGIIEIDLKEKVRTYICKLSENLYFGIPPKCSEKNESEIFFNYSMNAFTFDGSNCWEILKRCLVFTAPKLANSLLGVSSLMKKEVASYYLRTVENRMSRGTNNEHHHNIIDLVIQRLNEENLENSEEHMKKDKSKQTITGITAQLCTFLFTSLDGFTDTFSFVIYELAVNQDIQKRLREEFEANSSEGDCHSYDTIINQEYLDMVISETMRKWPVSILVDRVCTEPYKIDPVVPGEPSLQLEIGDTIAAPLYGLHHDPQYFPNPTKFDPERFSQENRSKIKPFTYLPWGIGSKNCNGIKLSLAMMKITLFYLLKHFELTPTSNTSIPIVLMTGDIKLSPEGGIAIGLKRRAERPDSVKLY